MPPGDALRSHEHDIDVSVLVPFLNEASHLPAVVPAMLAQRFDGEIEYLFIDGGSTDGSRELVEAMARSDPRIRLLDNPDRWTPLALNLGLAHARGRYVARMDAHTFYPPDYLAIGVARLDRGDVVSVSGPMLAEGTDTWSSRIALALRTSVGIGGARFRREEGVEHEVDSGFTGLWRRDTLVDAGGWEPEWINDQDLELAARLRGNGGRIVCVPAMAARYIPRNSLKALTRQYFRYGVYRVKTSDRHPTSLRRSQLLAPALLATLAVAAVAPRPLRRLARGGLGAYVAVLGKAVVDGARRGEAREAIWLPVVLPTMHLAYAVGTVVGCTRFGVPFPALRHAVLPSRTTPGG